MNTRVFAGAAALRGAWLTVLAGLLVGTSSPVLSQEMEQRFETRRSALTLVQIVPALEQVHTVVLDGPGDVSVIVGEDLRSLRLTAADGRLVTVAAEIFALAEVTAVLSASGESATIAKFSVPVTVTVTALDTGMRRFSVSGALAARSWSSVLGLSEISREIMYPRTTTLLGDGFRAIGTLIDLTAGSVVPEPKLSDEELIRRLSAEVVRLRTDLGPSKVDQGSEGEGLKHE